jgi:hypothetical protein
MFACESRLLAKIVSCQDFCQCFRNKEQKVSMFLHDNDIKI